jgi:hypothetical protein
MIINVYKKYSRVRQKIFSKVFNLIKVVYFLCIIAKGRVNTKITEIKKSEW